MSASDSDGNWNLDAVGGGRHSSNGYDGDLSKLKCFKCQKFGHISVNSPERKKGKGVIKGKGKQQGKKGKGKGEGFGKKGEIAVLVAQLVSRHSCVADRLPVQVKPML